MQIQLIDIGKTFKDKEIFGNVNLEINKGEFVFIHGKSGSGKTTLLNIIGGLERQTKGKYFVNGKEIKNNRNRAEIRRNSISFIFQDYGLIDSETVKENLMIISCFRDISNKDLESVLERVGISSKILNRKVYELSGGEQQRISIARALLKKTPILLADEPTGNLDKDNAENIFKILRELNCQGNTVICVSHDMEIYKHFDKHFIISENQIKEEL